jgi:hypothetical protein
VGHDVRAHGRSAWPRRSWRYPIFVLAPSLDLLVYYHIFPGAKRYDKINKRNLLFFGRPLLMVVSPNAIAA